MEDITTKELTAEEILQEQITTAEEELKQYTEAIEQLEKDIENYEVQAKIHDELRQLRKAQYMKNPEHIVWQYETNPRWWELQKEALFYSDREQEQKDKGVRDRFNAQLEMATEEKNKAEAKLGELLAGEVKDAE